MWETWLDNAVWCAIGFVLGVCAGRAQNALRDIRTDMRKLLDRTSRIEQKVAPHDEL